MPIQNGVKMACLPCIRGHRTATCNHSKNRTLLRVRKPGRPLKTCPHRYGCDCDCQSGSTALPRRNSCPPRPRRELLNDEAGSSAAAEAAAAAATASASSSSIFSSPAVAPLRAGSAPCPGGPLSYELPDLAADGIHPSWSRSSSLPTNVHEYLLPRHSFSAERPLSLQQLSLAPGSVPLHHSSHEARQLYDQSSSFDSRSPCESPSPSMSSMSLFTDTSRTSSCTTYPTSYSTENCHPTPDISQMQAIHASTYGPYSRDLPPPNPNPNSNPTSSILPSSLISSQIQYQLLPDGSTMIIFPPVPNPPPTHHSTTVDRSAMAGLEVFLDTIAECDCGPECQCIGCEMHPYNHEL